MDGLAGGLSAIAAVGAVLLAMVAGLQATAQTLLIPYVPGAEELSVLGGALLGACLGFLWWNGYPAQVFMPRADFAFVNRGDVNTLDLQKMSWMQDLRVARILFQGLVANDVFTNDYAIIPAMAESWELSDDGLEYTFHIREEAKWSNGEPVTAGDFVYSWRRAILPDTAADYTKLFQLIEGASEYADWRQQQLDTYAQQDRSGLTEDQKRERAEALWDEAQSKFEEMVALRVVDDRTLWVKLKLPTPYFLDLLAFAVFYPVYPPLVRQYESVDPDTGFIQAKTGWTKPPELVSNGPYMQSPFDIPADLDTPVSAYRKLGAFKPCFLLESAESGTRLARYSFIGLDPAFTARLPADGSPLTIRTESKIEESAVPTDSASYLAMLRDLRDHAPSLGPVPAGVPFAGGIVGVSGYDAVRFFEPLPAPVRREAQAPIALYCAPRSVLIFDHLTRRMVSPVTRDDRLARIIEKATGFVYAVTSVGVTGQRRTDQADIVGYLKKVRNASSIPVCAGFGIREKAHVDTFRGACDGVIIGSALMEAVGEGRGIGPILKGLR